MTSDELRNRAIIEYDREHDTLGAILDSAADEIERLTKRVAELEADTKRYRSVLERMLSVEFDWNDGEIGVGHKFRNAAREAIAREAKA